MKCNPLDELPKGFVMSDVDAMRKIAVILVADVVGYSKHMEQDEKATLEAYAECENLLKDLLEKRNGSILILLATLF